MIRLHTLGSLDLSDTSGRSIRSVVQQPRPAALLVYLAAAGGDRWYRRDTLLATFWPDADEEHARASLSQALYQLRRALGGDVILSRGVEEVGVATDLWCDAVQFERLLRERNTDEALALYRGAFLDGFFISDAPEFEQWAERERERLRRAAVDAMGSAADAEAVRGSGAQAVELARRAVATAPTDEAALRRLLTILVRFGDRAGAIQTYESFAAKLRDDFDLAPSSATRAFAESIRTAAPAFGFAEAPSIDDAQTIAPPVIATAALPVARPVRSSRARRWTAVAASAVLAIAGLTVYFGRRAGMAADSGRAAGTMSGAGVADAGLSVAVLPFINMNASGKGGDYFSDGLTEQLITALTHVPHLRVAARTSAFAFKNAHAAIPEIGRALGVRYLVEGSARQDGARLLVTARLVDARDRGGVLVWASTYDRTLSDIFAIQEELSRAIVGAIEQKLVPDTARALVRTTANVAAYNEFLKGRYHFNLRSPDHAPAAVQAFGRAVALDSTFAAAWSGLADAYASLPYSALASGRDMLPRATAAAHRALALDSTLAEPHSTLGWIAYAYEWDWATAEREFETALRLNPNYPDALHHYSLYLSRVPGDRERALAIAERAQFLDPLAPVIQGGAGAVYYHTGDYDRSIAAHLHALALDSTIWVVRGLLGMTYLAASRPNDALRELRQIPPGLYSNHGGPPILGVAFVQLGMADSARAMLALSPTNRLARTSWRFSMRRCVTKTPRSRRSTGPSSRAILWWLPSDTNRSSPRSAATRGSSE
jgi:TolB-like protein/DNA-binding SARP family transcriptional activator